MLNFLPLIQKKHPNITYFRQKRQKIATDRKKIYIIFMFKINKWYLALLFAAVMAVSLPAQTFTEESLLETGVPVIKINIENGAGITSKEVYVKIESFTLTDPNDSRNNIFRQKSDAARPDRPADEIRGRGNASWAKPEWNLDYPKKPYRIRFTEQLQLLGLPEARNWILLAEYRDPTFLYNPLAFEAARNIFEMPFTHHYYHVHLFLNGNYRGLYGLTEQKQVHKNRINIDPDYGWYVDIDSYWDEEPKFRTTNYNIPVMIKSPEPEGAANMSNPAYNFVRDDWNGLSSLMASGNFPESGYRDLIDINALIDYLIVNEIAHNQEFGNEDNVRSLLAYKDKGGKIMMGPVWDFDCGFGYNYQSTHRYFTTYNQFIKKVQFLQRFYDDPIFRVRFRERWNEKYNKIMDLSSYVENMGQKIRAAVTKDTERWLVSGNNFFPNSNEGYIPSEYITNHADAVNQLKVWLNSRISWLNGEINNRYTGTINIASAAVTLSDTLYYYDGTAKTPRAVVESYGKKLTEGTHYTLAYENNTDIGDAIVTITGTGDYYNSSINASFKIADGSSVVSSSSEGESSSSSVVSSSSADESSSSSEDSIAPIAHSLPPVANSKVPTYYTIKGEPVGSAKPAKPGVYLVKRGKSVQKIVVR
jgi:hypothetical protein